MPHGAVLAPPAGRHHDHRCLVFDGDADGVAAFGRFAREGLRSGHQVVIATGWDPDRIRGATDLPRLAAAEASGQLRLLPPEECYADRSGDEQIEWLRDTAAASTAAGYPALRVAADATGQIERTGWDAFLDYEMQVDRFLLGAAIVGMCGYDRRALPPSHLAHLTACHPTCDGASPMITVVADPDGARVRGDLDPSVATMATRLLVRPDLVAGDAIDLAGLEFVDLAGARSLMAALRRLRDSGRPVILRHPPRTLETILDVLDRSGDVTIESVTDG